MGALGILGLIGGNLRTRLRGMLVGSGFFFQVIKESVRFFRKSQVGYRVLTMQILFTGVESLGIMVFLAMTLGTVIISQGYNVLSQFGQTKLMYSLLIIIITRELGPLLAAFIIIARSGTAIATELGGMVVNHEIEAYQSVGINPISYLVVPRFLGMILSMVLLTVYFNFFGLFGAYFPARLFSPLDLGDFLHNLGISLSIRDIVYSLVKAAVFGGIISIVASYFGLRVQNSITEIPQAGIKAVGNSILFIIVADILLSALYYAGA